MSLKTLIQSLTRKELLLPRLRSFLIKESVKHEQKLFQNRDVVIQDAWMTIRTFKERIKEYNHGDFVGEFFHPSQLGACKRAVWFDRFNAPKNSKPVDVDDLLRVHLIFETGTYVGVMFQNLCARAGLLTRREIPIVSRKYRILGHEDGEVKLDGELMGLEIKTINARQFAEVKKREAPKETHVLQLNTYMKCVQQKRGIIVYLEKDRHQALEYVIEFDQRLFDKSQRAIDLFFHQVRQRKLPEQEGATPNEFPCTWCDYSHVCFGTRELKQFLKTVK
jgi:CRISPR/Cas system-associated exonuclease Cas4 (RecB family)